MSLNPREEATYRLELTEGYLKRAEKAFQMADLSRTVAEARLCVGNAAKAVISCFQIPSWSHDPSEEILSVIEQNQCRIAKLMGLRFLKQLRGLAENARKLAPEHGRATYGDVEQRIPPWRIFTKENAKTALEYARKSYKVAKEFTRTLYTL